MSFWILIWADQFKDTPKWYHKMGLLPHQGSLNQADLFAYMQVVAWCLIPPAMMHELGDTTVFFLGVKTDASRTWIGVSFVTRNNTVVNLPEKHPIYCTIMCYPIYLMKPLQSAGNEWYDQQFVLCETRS